MVLIRMLICLAGAVFFAALAILPSFGVLESADSYRLLWAGSSLFSLACAWWIESRNKRLDGLLPQSRKTEFQDKAAQLSIALHEIAKCLDNHDGTDFQKEYGARLACGLRRQAAVYDRAIFEARCRETAADVLSGINEGVHHIGACASKGEMNFDFGMAMRDYQQLHTIFREPRYRGEEL